MNRRVNSVGPGARIAGQDTNRLDHKGVLVLEFQPDGEYGQVAFFQHDNLMAVTGVALDSIGRVYLAGRLGDIVDLGGYLLGKADIYSGYVIRLNELGRVDWAFETWSTEVVQVWGVALDARGNVYCAPCYLEQLFVGMDTLSAVGGYDCAMFITHPDSTHMYIDTSLNSSRHDVVMNLSPNGRFVYVSGVWGSGYLGALKIPEKFLGPVSNVSRRWSESPVQYLYAQTPRITVLGMTEMEAAGSRVVDALGRTVCNSNALSVTSSQVDGIPAHQFDLSTLGDGIYFLVSTCPSCTSRPLILQGEQLWTSRKFE